MNLRFHRNFEKSYRKLEKSKQKKVKERLSLFLKDEFNPVLNNHPLAGKYKGYRSINITGDIRTLYKHTSQDERIFVLIDTHSNLYR